LNGNTLLLGGGGFLARYFSPHLRPTDFVQFRGQIPQNNFAANLIRTNLVDEAAVIQLLENYEFKTLINCVALADIDKCEKNPELALWANTEIPKILAKYCHEFGITLIHISTDAVYDGKISFPNEEIKTNPISVYGKTKALAEEHVMKICPESYIFRVNFVGTSMSKLSLFDYFFQNLTTGKICPGYTNVFFTPMYARDTTQLALNISNNEAPGLYHLVGAHRVSKFEFGRKVAQEMNLEPSLVRPEILGNQKVRSVDLSLSTEKVKNLGYQIPDFDEMIKNVVIEKMEIICQYR
jgi:dTDP-4-dehydrorhamnose reductase